MKKRFVLLLLVGLAGLAIALKLVLVQEETADVAPPREALEGTRSVNVYFPSSAGGVIREAREIVGGDFLEDDVRRTLEELMMGGESGERALPPATTVRRVFFDGDGEVTVDFSGHLRSDHPGGSDAELATLRCIVTTISSNFPGVDAIRVLVDGESVPTLAGHADLSRPLRPNDFH